MLQAAWLLRQCPQAIHRRQLRQRTMQVVSKAMRLLLRCKTLITPPSKSSALCEAVS